MAHQAHILPWHMIADNLKFVHQNHTYRYRTDLYPCFNPGQGEQLHHFTRVFGHAIETASTKARKSYPEAFPPPSLDEIFIPNSSVKRIAHTIAWYKTDYPLGGPNAWTLAPTEEERKFLFWRKDFDNKQPRSYWQIHSAINLLKTLVLHGEMAPLLRLAVHPDQQLPPQLPFAEENEYEYDWNGVKDRALVAYMCLNVLFVRRELYNAETRAAAFRHDGSGRSEAFKMKWYDYRYMRSYQKMMLKAMYLNVPWDVCALPHREFLGIDKGMDVTYDAYTFEDRLGAMSASQFLSGKHRACYLPCAADVDVVLGILRTRVPVELALEILEFADYRLKRRIPVAHDPLHAGNTQELKDYLGDCWELLVRCDVVARAHGTNLDWTDEARRVIEHLWGVEHPRNIMDV